MIPLIAVGFARARALKHFPRDEETIGRQMSKAVLIVLELGEALRIETRSALSSIVELFHMTSAGSKSPQGGPTGRANSGHA